MNFVIFIYVCVCVMLLLRKFFALQLNCLNQSRVVSSFQKRIINTQIFATRILMNPEYLVYSYILSFYMSVFCCCCCCCFSFSVEFYNQSNILLRPINETLSIPSYQEKFFVDSFHFFSLILFFAKDSHNLLIFPTTDFILFNIQFLKWNYIWFKLQKIHRMRNTYKNMSFMRHIIIFNLQYLSIVNRLRNVYY